ncbi:MAG: N-acetyltransferase [Dehalococcoidia bacterium]|nr:N-acetyltransferase [Dehalococcoidia bacterium]
MSARNAEVVAETLHTARLDLVPYDLDFCRAIVAGDRDVAAEWMGADLGAWPGGGELKFGFPSNLWALREDSSALGWHGRAVIVRMHGVVAGSVNLKGRPRNGRIEVGWELERIYRHQGYAHEGARAVVAYAFGHREVREVVAEIDPANAPSIAVAESVGMHRTDEASTQHAGSMLWVVTRAEFEALR